MKAKLWILQIPIILIFTAAFWINRLGDQGLLENRLLREKIFPTTRTVSTFFTDLKFKMRGPQPPRNKVVVVEIDNAALESYGRWPWHRDLTAVLIDRAFEAGAKAVGLDMVFSEPDTRVPEGLAQILQKNKMGNMVEQFETDHVLSQIISRYRDRLVTGWTADVHCQPLYSAYEECPVDRKDVISTHPKNFDKFAITQMNLPREFAPTKTPLVSVLTYIANLPEYNAVATHSGFFNAFPDPDGYIRRAPLIMISNQKAYPTLPLEMARIALNEDLSVDLGSDYRVRSLKFARSGRLIPVTPSGTMEINFRGPGRTFPYISAVDLMSGSDKIQDFAERKLASASKKEALKDAHVLIGLSALGVYDMRAFPFDSNVAGVEGHATILDNLLSGDPMVSGADHTSTAILLLLMIGGALGFAVAVQKLDALPALLLFAGVFAAIAIIDTRVFAHAVDWDTSFLCLELGCMFAFSIAAKYLMEERDKKFIRGAFTKYVSSAVVDSILKDPSSLSLGGEKKELTILFSDIRGFTSFSERMDAKALAGFLNDYLGIMTDIVFKYGGTLDKYIGDAVMAFWGAPLELPGHASQACQAAIAMMKALEENRERFQAKYGVHVAIGIGINSGMVNVGNMGSSNNFEYTVIGDHVNLASRLEGLTKTYGASMLTTRFTFDDILAAGGTLPPHRTLDLVKVKGRSQAVELIQIIEGELSTESLTRFEQGRRLYLAQKWDEAIQEFQKANGLVKSGDESCKMYIERCEEFKKSPPGLDWDGTWEMHSK